MIKYDGFIKDDPSLDKRCPGIVFVTEWCFVDVSYAPIKVLHHPPPPKKSGVDF